MKLLEHKIPPPMVAGLVGLAMWGVSSLQPLFPLDLRYRQFVVVVLGVAGITFDFLGLLVFLRSKTTINPMTPHKTSTLVTGGIYRITRNPMYVGLALLLTAWAIHLDSLRTFLGPPLFILYIGQFQIQPEEKVLKRIFGEEYAMYAARVRRWL